MKILILIESLIIFACSGFILYVIYSNERWWKEFKKRPLRGG